MERIRENRFEKKAIIGVAAGSLGLLGIAAIRLLLGEPVSSASQTLPPLPLCEYAPALGRIIKTNEPCLEEPIVKVTVPYQDTSKIPVSLSK